MTPTGANFALIGRSYPCEVFELWSQVSRSARERRQVARAAYGPRSHEVVNRLPFPRQETNRN